MPGLDPAGVVVAQRLSDLAGDGAGEETAAHPDAAVDLPALDRKPGLRERALPGEDVGVDGVYERSIEIENECAHAWLGPSLIRHRELTPATHRRTLAQTSGLTT